MQTRHIETERPRKDSAPPSVATLKETQFLRRIRVRGKYGLATKGRIARPISRADQHNQAT